MCKKKYYQSDTFSLDIFQTATNTDLTMELHKPIVNTKELPHTLPFLREHFPGVLRTKCYNEQNLPFKKEVVRTEIGHLFEHIILEELCSLKIADGACTAIHSGETSWNWVEEAEGIFHITIDIGNREFMVLSKAVSKASYLIESLFAVNKLYGQPDEVPVESIYL